MNSLYCCILFWKTYLLNTKNILFDGFHLVSFRISDVLRALKHLFSSWYFDSFLMNCFIFSLSYHWRRTIKKFDNTFSSFIKRFYFEQCSFFSCDLFFTRFIWFIDIFIFVAFSSVMLTSLIFLGNLNTLLNLLQHFSPISLPL